MDMLTSPPPGGCESDIWRQLADHVPHMLWMAGAQGRLTWTNRCCSDTLCSAPEHLIGRGWDTLVHPDDSERIAAAWSSAITNGEAFEIVARLKATDRRSVYYLFKAEPHRDSDGTVTQWFGSSTDVTDRIAAARHDADLARVEAERTNAERALSDADARFRAVLNNTEMAIFLLDEQMHCLYANDAAEALTGYSFAELQGRALHDVVHHSKPDRSPCPVHECPIGEGTPEHRKSEGEEMFVARDGSFYPVYYSASPVFDEQGRAVGTVLEARNIAAAKARKAELEASEAQFRTTAEAVPGLLFVTDAAGENTYVNRFYRDYTGVDQATSRKWWRGLIHPDDLDLVMTTSQQAREKGEDFRLDYRIRRHDGQFRWHSTKASPTIRPDGSIERWVGVSLDIHDRRIAEEQARLAAEEIAATYATAPIGLAVFDPELRYVRINDRLAEMNGLPASDHIGKTLHEVVPDISGPLAEVIARALKGEEVHGFEVSGETASAPGVFRTWRENWLPIRGFDGQITGAAGSVEEITAEKEAELALARSEAQFRTLAEALPGMLFITDPDGANSYVNETFARYSGLPKEELLGTGWAQLLHPDDRSRVREVWNRAVATGEIYEIDYRFRRHDGEWRWFQARALRIPSADPDGREQWVGTCTDIHEARIAEQEIAVAEARYRAMFEQAGVGVARVAPDGSFLEINDRYCEILRRPRGAVLKASWRDITHPDDIKADVIQLKAMLRGEIESFSVEKRYLGPHGEHIWVNLTLGAQRDGDGKVLFFIPVVEDIGARKAAEERLRAGEERYRTLFNSMEQGFCTIQVSFDDQNRPVDYRFTELNPAFTRHTGLAQNVLNRSVREAVPGLEEAWFERYGQIALTGQQQRFIDHAEALGRWFEVYGFPIGDPADHSVAILFSDVTERIEQEQSLRRSAQELRLRLNAIPQMVWTTLPDGYHDFFNDRWYEFTGTPLGATDGEAWNDLFHPDDQPALWERWRTSLATGKPYEIEYRLRHHSGDYRWVLGRALPIRDEAGEIVRWMGTCTDIDDRVEAERRQRATEARLRAVIEATPVGLVFADPSGRITGGNAQVEEIVGHSILPSERVSEYDQWVSYHPDGRQVAGEEYPLSRVLAEGQERSELEVHYQRGDGRRSWVRFSAAPIRDDSGAIIGGVVASIDIDREKRLTETLEREVEKVIAEREAAQEALRQSQKLEAMGQLTGGVAHDFNNLLTPIIGSLDLLQRKQILDERTGRLVEGALASAEKARVLVQRLLAFARRQPLKPQAIDLKRVIAEMSDLVDSTSGPRIRVLTDVPDELPTALADGNQLEMALLNLSVNARDAMPDGGTLSIAARSEPEGSGRRLGLSRRPHVVLAVSDTGVGMDEDTRRRAIEPFFSTKGVGKGTGLGLSMVHGLAAQLGGALDIKSAPGVGTTIELWLPLAGEAAADVAGDGAEAEAQGAGTVLLVDDEELVRASTAGMLADLGYRVIEAESGEAAMALVAQGVRPNLLVTDQLMPGLSGTDLAVQLREHIAGLPVLVVSGYADLESLSPSFPHLSKPFRQAELAAALEKVTA